MSYSQNNEEQIIGSYFGEFRGHLLSLGENDGYTLSNSRALIEKGWSADLVEPSPGAFQKLKDSYRYGVTHPVTGDSNIAKIKLHNVAIGNAAGRMPFYDSGTLLKTGDRALVSTLSTQETKRWGNSVEFQEIEVDVITVKDLLNQTMANEFHFISIDCEGLDLDILKQMDLSGIGCKCLCVEFNGRDQPWYDHHVRQFGFRLLHQNAENLIYVK